MAETYNVQTSVKLSRGIKGSIQRIFVGEQFKDQVIVYKYDEINKLWYKEYTISSPSTSFLKFGFSLAGTDNASILAVGDPGTTEGRVCVFQKDIYGVGWSQRGSTVAHPLVGSSGSESDGFGYSISLSKYDGNILVVGAPLYNVQTPNYQDINFTVSEGRIFIFIWGGSSYSLQQTISSPSGTLSSGYTTDSWKNFYFGYSLDISDIGNMIIVGSPSFRSIGSADLNTWTGGLFQDVSVYDEYYEYFEDSAIQNKWPYTGNAHVYHNNTVLSGGTTWTSNVNVTEVIGVTGIGTLFDLEPEKIRPYECVGTVVGINRAGTRIFASAPYSYGTSNTSPQIFSGRIYTLEWNPITNTWYEMGKISKHIIGGINFTLLGYSAEFDGSGNRIVAGAPEFYSITKVRLGKVEIFDWNGDDWISYPTTSVIVDVATYNSIDAGFGNWLYWYNNIRFGDSVSVDGEGEMIAIGMDDNKIYSGDFIVRPKQFSVYGITYIGGATTTVSGNDADIYTGTSNIWVYNVPQSMIVTGNMTISGCLQTSGIAVGSNDDSDTSRKSIFFGGTKADNSYDYTVIENRVYESAEKSELLIFKGDNNADADGGGIYGPDRIRLKSGQIVFDLNAGYQRDTEDIRFVMNKNKLQAGKFGVNTVSPREAIDVHGKIRSTQGFIGRGEELLGVDFHNGLVKINENIGLAGVAYKDITLGEALIWNSKGYPYSGIFLTSNISQGYIVSASFDSTNAYKLFRDDHTFWKLDTGSPDGISGVVNYTRFGNNIGYYLGTIERFPGYPGEWVEIQLAPEDGKIVLTDVYLNIGGFNGSFPKILHIFGSGDGINYYHIHTETKPEIYTVLYDTPILVYSHDPDNFDKYIAYNRFVFICTRVFVPFGGVEWKKLMIIGKSFRGFTPKIKLSNTGKIGIKNSFPDYELDVIGDINLTGSLRINGSKGNDGQVLISRNGISIWSQPDGWKTNTVKYPTIPLTDKIAEENGGGYIVTESRIWDPPRELYATNGNTSWKAFSNENQGWFISQLSTNGLLYPIRTYNRINGTYAGKVYANTGEYSEYFSTTYTSLASVINGEWVQLQVPTSIIITSINIAAVSNHSNPYLSQLDNALSRCVGDGTILGSTDGSTWFEIHSFSEQTYTEEQYTTISFTNSVAYSYFRLVVTRISTPGGDDWSRLFINSINFTTADGVTHPTSPITSESSGGYTAASSMAGGTGNTAESISYSFSLFTNSITNTGAINWLSFSYSYDNHDLFVATPNGYYFTRPNYSREQIYSTTYNKISTAGGEWIQLQVPTSIIITSMRLTPYYSPYGDQSRPAAGVILGSTDGSTWTEIHSFTDPPLEDPILEPYIEGEYYTDITFNNSFAYLYFRLIVTATASGDYEWGDPTYLRINKISFFGYPKDLYYNDGNIGIGTSSPAYNLDVAGDINFTDALYINGDAGLIGQVLTSSGGDLMTWSYSSGWWKFNNTGVENTYPTIPMTSASSGGYTASASFENNNSPAWKAFNNVLTWDGWVSLGGYSGYLNDIFTNSDTDVRDSHYVGSIYTTYNGSSKIYGAWIQLQLPINIIITSIKILPIGNYTLECAGYGTILGSTDGSTWFEIHSFSEQTYTEEQYTTISFTNSVAYSYFRLVVTRTSITSSPEGENTSLLIGEIKLVGYQRKLYYNDGNIGIGTSSPVYKLDVNGDINFTDGLYINGNAGLNGQILTSSGGGLMTWSDASGSVATWLINGNKLYYNSGYVGINMSDPNYELDVLGRINLVSGLFVNGSGGTNGQVLTSSGGSTMSWTTVSSSGPPIWSLNGSFAFYSGGNVGIKTSGSSYTLHVNGSLYYIAGGFQGSDDRIKYNEEDIPNALSIINKLKPQKYEKIFEIPDTHEGTWIPTDEEWENVKSEYKYGDEFGFIAQDVRNIPELSFLVHGEESRTDIKTLSIEEYSNLTTEEQVTYTISYTHYSNTITQEEYYILTPEEQEKFDTIYTKQIETETPIALNYQGLFVVAIGAIQELKVKNDILETQIADLLARVTALES